MTDPQTCPNCQQSNMPTWGDLATARRCQSCGFVEERYVVKEK